MKKEPPVTIQSREPEVRSLGTWRNRGNQEDEQVGSVRILNDLEAWSQCGGPRYTGMGAWGGGCFCIFWGLYLLGLVGLRSLLWAYCPRF